MTVDEKRFDIGSPSVLSLIVCTYFRQVGNVIVEHHSVKEYNARLQSRYR
jgi:hypothetical protein